MLGTRRSTTRRVRGLAALLALATGGGATAQAPQSAQELRVAPGILRGHLLVQGTRDPAGDARLALRSSDGRLLQVLETDASGGFATPSLAEGTYYLEVAPTMTLKLKAVEGAPVRSLDLVAPAGAIATGPAIGSEAGGAAPAGAGTAAGTAAAGGGLSLFGLSTTASWALIGVGAAVVAVPVAIAAGGGGGGETIVSPQRSSIR